MCSSPGATGIALWSETGTRVKRRLRIAGRACSAQCSDDLEERHVRSVFFTFCSGTDRGNDGKGCDCGPPKLTERAVQ